MLPSFVLFQSPSRNISVVALVADKLLPSFVLFQSPLVNLHSSQLNSCWAVEVVRQGRLLLRAGLRGRRGIIAGGSKGGAGVAILRC